MRHLSAFRWISAPRSAQVRATGPRYIRAESVMIRPVQYGNRRRAGSTRCRWPTSAMYRSIPAACSNRCKLSGCYTGLNSYPLIPLTLGGDHTITLPILRALAKKHGPVGLIHVDAHTDTNDEMFGRKSPTAPPSAAPLRRGLLDLKRVVQIGQRARAMPPATSSGALTRAFAWCRRSSAGIPRWRR